MTVKCPVRCEDEKQMFAHLVKSKQRGNSHDFSGRYVKRMDKKVISKFEKIISVCKEDGCDFVDLTFETAEQILALLKERERKKGSWDYGTQCSVCKGTIVPPWKRDTRVNFCPWCGADMRGGYDALQGKCNQRA